MAKRIAPYRYLVKLKAPWRVKFGATLLDFGKGEKILKVKELLVRQILGSKRVDYREVVLPGRDNSRAGEVATLKSKLSKAKTRINELENAAPPKAPKAPKVTKSE